MIGLSGLLGGIGGYSLGAEYLNRKKNSAYSRGWNRISKEIPGSNDMGYDWTKEDNAKMDTILAQELKNSGATGGVLSRYPFGGALLGAGIGAFATSGGRRAVKTFATLLTNRGGR